VVPGVYRVFHFRAQVDVILIKLHQIMFASFPAPTGFAPRWIKFSPEPLIPDLDWSNLCFAAGASYALI
jgi:hypothetical protein